MTTKKGGRPSPWKSTSITKLIRVPDWMVSEILDIARKKDEDAATTQNHHIDGIVQNYQCDDNGIVQNHNARRVDEVKAVIERYKKMSKTTRNWTEAKKLISDLETILEQIEN